VAAGVREPAGSARLELVSGVALLREEDAVLEAMLAGWARQQLGGRGLAPGTVKQRRAVVRQFLGHAGEYPWNWTAAHLDEWSADLVGVAGKAKSTIRNHHDAVRSFESYLVAPQYRWAEECQARFGTHPARICFESNTTAHLVDYEGDPDRRPMTREELQRFFDYADGRVDQAIRMGRKGALAAYRDATVFKVMYGWGLRVGEALGLRHEDLAAAEGELTITPRVNDNRARVKSARPRTIPVSPEVIRLYADYLHEEYGDLDSDYVFVNLWGQPFGRPWSYAAVYDLVVRLRRAAGVDFDPHWYRHTYATRLQMGRIAFGASFGSSCEHALPAAQRAALRCPGLPGAPRGHDDLGLHGPPGSDATMMRLIPLRGVHHRCAYWHRDASGSSQLHRVHHRRSG